MELLMMDPFDNPDLFLKVATPAEVEEKDPISDLDLATQVVEVIFAAYVSAEEGRRVELSGHFSQ